MKLPGEDKAKARPLKPEGAKAAAEDRETAERVAFALWEHAIEENAVRQIRLESTEKIERLKAQFLDKVRHFTELAETANARIEAEAAARAEAEAKLAQMAQGAGPRTEDATANAVAAGAEEVPDGLGGRPGQSGQGGRGGPDTASTPSTCAESEHGQVSSEPIAGNAGAAAPHPLAPGIDRGPTLGPPPAGDVVGYGRNIFRPYDPQPSLEKAARCEIPPLEIPTGPCDCCGATGIAMACLTRIDSGQSLCPRCLAAFRADIARRGE